MILRQLWLTVFISLQGILAVYGHIGEPCHSVLNTCFAGFQVLNRMYCDKDHICRCPSNYPVVIMPHTCKRAKKVGEGCSSPAECTTTDPNSFCSQSPLQSECQCHSGFSYNYVTEKCEKGAKAGSSRKTSVVSLIPSAVAFLFACFGLFCCFVFVWHSFCRKSPLTEWSARMEPRATSDVTSRLNGQNSTVSPSYEITMYDDQPPPPYEEAIKCSNLVPPPYTLSSKDTSL
ncbi:hypothetical protein HDE_13675 [Halotydeus destructor]|nr:hypothetical protein HDE_13675 [Halotydeus destructor]